MKKLLLFGSAVTLLAICALFEPAMPASASAAALQPAKSEPNSTSEASVTIGKNKIDYEVKTERLQVTDMTGKAKAKIFYTSYISKTSSKDANRPLTFCYNGGPGTSSVYVHLGAFSPRKVLMTPDGLESQKPAKLVENENTLLDISDIVFIDPVSTGYSRADEQKDAKLFHGVNEDTSSVGDFMRAYVAKFKRQDSPVFICGESYGTYRSASVAKYLQDKGGVKLVGVMLISTVLDFNMQGGGDKGSIGFFPTYTAAAHHHKKVDKSLGSDIHAIMLESEKFANGPYKEALAMGKGLTKEERKVIAKEVSKYTGLSEEYVLKQNLRIGAAPFRSELLREEGYAIGRIDARIKAKSGGGKGGKGGGGGDPSMSMLTSAYSECQKTYFGDVLKINTDLKYNISGSVNPWNYNNEPRTVVPRLKGAMEKDPNLRVFNACGYADMATPWNAAKQTLLSFGPALQKRIVITYYEGGHMMYAVADSHKRLNQDMHEFMRETLAQPGAKSSPAALRPGALEWSFLESVN